MAASNLSALKTAASKLTLWPHQKTTLSFLAEQNKALDNSDPGVGKTAVQVMHYMQRPTPRGRWLVVCPKTLMRSAWGADIERFAPSLSVAYATSEARAEAFQSGADVVIINSDGVKFFAGRKNLQLLKNFDHLTIDEYTQFKHPSAQRSKALASLRQLFRYRYGLSGTGAPNSVMELWHPMLIIDDGVRLGTSYTRLRSSVQTPIQVGPAANHIRWEDKPGVAVVINKLLSDVVIRHAFEDVMKDVPPNHTHTKIFTLSPTAQRLYDKMENDLVLALENDVVSAVHAASLRTKLLQIASGAVYTDDENAYKVIDGQRYELIGDLIDEVPHSVVFFNWHHQRDVLLHTFKKRKYAVAVIDGATPVLERARIVERYQQGEYKTLLLHPRTGAHGLTLTRGTTTVWASPIYEADLMKQGIARIYRGTQTQVTNTVFVEAAKTVERAVYERLQGKYVRMNDLLDLMKRRRTYG